MAKALTPRQESHKVLRRFDHDEARGRYAAGDSVPRLALRYGVSQAAISRIVVPGQYEKFNTRSVAWQQGGSCPDCGVRTTRRTTTWNLRCRRCAHEIHRTSVRPDTLFCSKCGEWKPDDQFPSAKNASLAARRHRHRICRPCGTAMRRDYRNRQKVPCVRCGNPCLPEREKGPRASDAGLCVVCFRAVYGVGRKRTEVAR